MEFSRFFRFLKYDDFFNIRTSKFRFLKYNEIFWRWIFYVLIFRAWAENFRVSFPEM